MIAHRRDRSPSKKRETLSVLASNIRILQNAPRPPGVERLAIHQTKWLECAHLSLIEREVFVQT